MTALLQQFERLEYRLDLREVLVEPVWRCAVTEHVNLAARRSDEIAKMDAERYASVIIGNAEYFLPKEVLAFFETQDFESDYDRALRYLAEMPASGVRVLNKG